MSTKFSGEGNLGGAPDLQYYPPKNDPDGEKQAVVNFSVRFDNFVPVGEEFVDKGGFWLDVSIWGDAALHCSRLLQKGSRVRVEGVLREHQWKDKETDEDRKQLQLNARKVYLVMSQIEAVTFKKSNRASSDGNNMADAD